LNPHAEVRGYRRTQIGALSGRIIRALRVVQTRAQDEPRLVDNYLGVPFDLSHVLFVATAATVDTIPPPLRNRLELIGLPGYADGEKVQIAQHYLVPKHVRAHGLTSDEVSFDDDSIRAIIRGYTREAGVRGLEREIGTVCWKVARDIAKGKPGGVRVTAENVSDFLSRPRFFNDVAERTDRSGVAALASLASGRPVRSDVGDERRDHVARQSAAVGGIREKVLAAQSAGITTVILPRRNERDLEDVPTELRQKLEFVFVDEATSVLDCALKGD
jgi:ATP-dependent Lon protease